MPSPNDRYQQLYTEAHQRRLEKPEKGELAELAKQLNQPNPLAPTLANVYTKNLVLNNQNQVLMLWRSEHTSRANGPDLPGGSLDFGEHPQESAQREILEETGLQIDALHLLAIKNYTYGQNFSLLFCYLGQTTNTTVTLSWEHQRYEWLDVDQALNLPNLPEEHRNLLKLLNNQPLL